VALMCHLLAQFHQITDLLIPLAHISLQHLQKMLLSTSKFQKPKPCWSYKWSPTPRRCKNLRFSKCSCRWFSSSETLLYIWGYSSSHCRELQSLHTDNNAATHRRRKRSSVTKKLQSLIHNSTTYT
jgi:hypothetical protein